MDGEVEPHQLCELSITVAQHVGKIVRPVQIGVDGPDAAAFAVQVAVDLGSNAGQLGNQVHGVFVDELTAKRQIREPWEDNATINWEPLQGKLTSQYLDLWTPSEYARAKPLSLFRAVMAALN